jgi:hypothetical protein
LNEVDPEKFPEVVALRKDLSTAKEEIGTCKEEIGNLQTAKGEAEDKANKYRIGTISLGVLALGLLILLGLRKSRSSGSAGAARRPGSNNPPARITRRPRRLPVTRMWLTEFRRPPDRLQPGLAAPGPSSSVVIAALSRRPAPAPAARTVVPADSDMAELAVALQSSGGQKPRSGGATPAARRGQSITADNVIIRGKDGRPSAEINRSVVMAEIACLNPKFLTDDGTAIHSNYRAGVEHLADSAMAAFGDAARTRRTPASSGISTALRFHDRGGLPGLVTHSSTASSRWHAAGAPGMASTPLRASMERDAARRARSACENVEEALRDPVRWQVADPTKKHRNRT